MGELLSVGLDVGTTSTQMIVSRLETENRASGFSVPELRITGRTVVYQSPIHFTPLLSASRIDGDGVRRIVEAEYQKAGIHPRGVDTGAVIITGETSRKENAAQVTQALSEYAGDFVVATAGPDLESRLAAQGSGAVGESEKTGRSFLHMDIGGGTSNLAWIAEGKIVATSCLNVGGRLVKLDKNGAVTYVSPVLKGVWDCSLGEKPGEDKLEALTGLLVQALEMAAGLREKRGLLKSLMTAEASALPELIGDFIPSFSGGVADCIEKEVSLDAFGDIGPRLGRAIRKSRLCAKQYRVAPDGIRATVIGAGCYAMQLSGSTVYCRDARLPVKNLPVAQVEPVTAEALTHLQQQQEGQFALALGGMENRSYRELTDLADTLAAGLSGDITVCMEGDFAKALGNALALRLPRRQILCIDRVKVGQGDYLDIGNPVGPALPVVVKTLVFGQ